MIPPSRTIHAWTLVSLGVASFCVIYELRTFSSRSWRACLLLAEARPGLGLVETCQRGFLDVWPHAYPRLGMHFLQTLLGVVGLAYTCATSAHVRQLVAPALDALGLAVLLDIDEARIEAIPETPAQRQKSLADLPELAWLRSELSPEDDAFDPSRPQGNFVATSLRSKASGTKSSTSVAPAHKPQREQGSGNGAEPGGHALHPRLGFVPRALYDRWREAEAERTLAQFARRAQEQPQTHHSNRGSNSSNRSCSRPHRLPPVRNTPAYFKWQRKVAGDPVSKSTNASKSEANGHRESAADGRAHLRRNMGAAAESQSLPSTVSYAPQCSFCQGVTDTTAGSRTLACTRCGLVEYCGDKCRRAHWKAAHKKSCCAVRDTSTATSLMSEESSLSAKAMQQGIEC